MKTWLREPLLHFLLLGAALFALYRWVGGGDAAPERIVVSAATIERLADTWQRTWQRPPTRPELDGLIEDHVREEVLYREAMAAGLDRDDKIIRRRLRKSAHRYCATGRSSSGKKRATNFIDSCERSTP